MKTVVFGAAGWLGRAVLQNLAGKHDIRAFDYGPKRGRRIATQTAIGTAAKWSTAI